MAPRPPPLTRPTRFGTSTKWPGITSVAVYAALLGALLAVTQVILGAVIMHELELYPDDDAYCLTDLVALEEKLPTRIVAPGETEGWGLDTRPGMYTELFSCVLLTICSLISSITLVFAHFRAAGLKHRHALLQALLLLVIYCSALVGNARLTVDVPADPEWETCRVSSALAGLLLKERTFRLALLKARLVVAWVALGVAWVYAGLASWAGWLAWREGRRSAVRTVGLGEVGSAYGRGDGRGDRNRNGESNGGTELRNLPSTLASHSADDERTLNAAVSTPLPTDSLDDRREVLGGGNDSGLGGKNDKPAANERDDDWDVARSPTSPFADPSIAEEGRKMGRKIV